MSDATAVTVSYVLQTVIPDTEPVFWKDEMSLDSFKDPAYRTSVLVMYRQAGKMVRMVRMTVTEEVLDE
jgi:hypothetical protein